MRDEKNKIIAHLETIASADSADYFLSKVSKYFSSMLFREEKEREREMEKERER